MDRCGNTVHCGLTYLPQDGMRCQRERGHEGYCLFAERDFQAENLVLRQQLEEAKAKIEKWQKVADSVERGWNGLQAELQQANGALETMRRQTVEKNAALDLAEQQLEQLREAAKEAHYRLSMRANEPENHDLQPVADRLRAALSQEGEK